MSRHYTQSKVNGKREESGITHNNEEYTRQIALALKEASVYLYMISTHTTTCGKRNQHSGVGF